MVFGLELSAFRLSVEIDDLVLDLESSTLGLQLWLEFVRVSVSVRGRGRVRVHLGVGVGVGLGLWLRFLVVESRFWVRLRARIAFWVRIECIPS